MICGSAAAVGASSKHIHKHKKTVHEKRNYKYYDLIMAAFVAVLLCSNLIGVQKVSSINLPFYGEYIYGAGVLFFTIINMFGDIMTEV
jgi:queuosine precursor transporter